MVSILLHLFQPKLNLLIQINWITASETNNSHFEIQRSSDGLNFETIIRCQGAGNSSMYISYLEIDNNPLEGISYYRLKQVDYDGAAEVFSMVPVKCLAEKEPAISLFPNPVSKDAKQVNLLLEGFEGEEVLVILRDITGKEIASKVRIVKSGYEIHAYPLDVEINAGNYIVTASSNNSIYSKVLIID